jgi:hypothetical protein
MRATIELLDLLAADSDDLPEDDEDPSCARCGQLTFTHFGLERSPVCDPCAQDLVRELAVLLIERRDPCPTTTSG